MSGRLPPAAAGPWRLEGVLLPGAERRPCWLADGRLTFEPVAGADTLAAGVWILPGLADAHCHIGLGPTGAVTAAVAEAQALADRDAGTLLIRDAGSPADTRWADGRPDLPRLIRAGRHIARPYRYLRDYAVEVAPADLAAEVQAQAARGDGWVKLVG
ncbi:MAG: amidohydrolase, partial [Propionibacteriaceae bacterium]|nr:amidohydrolase [Propionibacteriaceae bacterium]